MDLNLVVLCGRLATPPEIRTFTDKPGGYRLWRGLIAIRQEEPRRVDVVPVTLWDPPQDLIDADPAPGTTVWVAGSVQRRFWTDDPEQGRRSRLEIIAHQVCIRPPETR